MRAKNVRDVRGCKRYLLHSKPLYRKALRGYLGNVRDISNIEGEEKYIYTDWAFSLELISISYTYIFTIYNKHIYLGSKR